MLKLCTDHFSTDVLKERILILVGLLVPVLLNINRRRTGCHKCSAITRTHLDSKLVSKMYDK